MMIAQAQRVSPLGLGSDERVTMQRAADVLLRVPYEFWRYGDSIAFEALVAATELLGDNRYQSFATGALLAWYASRPFSELDDRAPGLAACLIAHRDDDPRLRQMVQSLGAFLAERPTSDGAFICTRRAPLREPFGDIELSPQERDLLNDPGPAVMLNGLHVNAPFFAALGRLAGDDTYIRLAIEQALVHMEILDAGDGMLHHLRLEKTSRSYGKGWGRGHAWALHGIVQVLGLVPRSTPGWAELADVARGLTKVLEHHQIASGAWARTLTGDTVVETSVSAFDSAAIARGVTLGVLDRSLLGLAVSAFDTALGYMDSNGVLTNVSVNVGASTADAHYFATPLGSGVTWGQGPIVLAAHALNAAYASYASDTAATTHPRDRTLP